MNMRIRIDESRLNFPLAPIYAGVLSSLYLEVVDVPDTVDTLGLLFEYGDGTHRFRADCSKDGDTWKCYVNPYVFPAVNVSGALAYHAVATDGHGNEQWLGTGRLYVYQNPANGSSDAPAVVPKDTYIRNPATGLYHLLTASVDEDGNLTVSLSEEGVER